MSRASQMTLVPDFLQHFLTLRLRRTVEPHVVLAVALAALMTASPVLLSLFLGLQRFQGTAKIPGPQGDALPVGDRHEEG